MRGEMGVITKTVFAMVCVAGALFSQVAQNTGGTGTSLDSNTTVARQPADNQISGNDGTVENSPVVKDSPVGRPEGQPLRDTAGTGNMPLNKTAQTVPAQQMDSPGHSALDKSDIATAVQIPGGVLFGEFTKEDGPFLLQGSIIVPSGQTLEFKEGCKVYVGGKYSTITVFGQLNLQGTPSEPVVIQSASKDPKPWDWDRIYIRSRYRSIFENCVIRHSNYGIFVENGSASIRNSLFESNSLHGLVVKNSDVIIANTTFKRGHVCAILCQEGANVFADSLVIRNNITGIACTDQSFFKMEKGEVRGNTSGLAVMQGASVNLIAADITSNKTGIVSEIDINKKVREMVYKNNLDLKIVTPEEMKKILKAPEGVKTIVLPKSASDIQVSSNFKPGFSALQAPREATASFIGNVSAGFSYFDPLSDRHPVDIDTSSGLNALYPQTKYLGEHSDDWYSKFQPELVVFAQGKNGLLDVNLNADLYVNDWVPNHVRADMFTLAMNYADQRFIVGDFYENISETSISGRKLRGIKYLGSFLPMGRGTNRVEFKLAAGESELKKDLGEHEIELFSDTVDTGSSIRQQLTYVANLAVKPAHNVTISARGIISHDQDSKGLFVEELSDSAAPRPISGATGSIDANVVLFDGNLAINAEVDMGAHDTVDSNDWDAIAWYKPQVTQALPRVFGVIRPDSNNYALLFNAEGIVNQFELSAGYMEIAEHYFSAGNPYLEPDRRVINAGGKKQFSEQFSANLTYEYERTSVSNVFALDNESPTDNNTADLLAEYSFGEGKPAISGEYGIRFQTKDDMGSYTEYVPEDTVVDSITGNSTITYSAVKNDSMYAYNRVDNSVSLEVKQQFENGIDYSIKYQMVRKNDFSRYPDSALADDDDSWENTITGRFGFRIAQRLRNKISGKIKFKNEVDMHKDRIDYKISDNLRFNIIPRKLALTLTGEYRKQTEEIDNDTLPGIRNIVELNQKTIEAELKYTITSRLSLTAMGKFEEYYDEAQGSTENYTVKIGGLHLTYLF